MNDPKNLRDADISKVSRAQFRMAFWPFLMYMIGLVWAYLSVPFDGLHSATQNLVYSVLVAGPFWIAILIFLVLVWRELHQNG